MRSSVMCSKSKRLLLYKNTYKSDVLFLEGIKISHRCTIRYFFVLLNFFFKNLDCHILSFTHLSLVGLFCECCRMSLL